MVNSQSSNQASTFTEYGIPIRNLWYMLLYAWNEVPLNAVRGWTLDAVDTMHPPTLDALLALVLIKLVQQRLRIGLGHEYVNEERSLRGIRGRVQFAETLKNRTLERGQVVCEYQGYSANSINNQIARSTLARLLKLGQFGSDRASVKEIHQRLRRLLRDLDGIDFIELTPELLHRQFLRRNDHDYRLMLAICDLIVQRQMPGGSGMATIVPAVDRDIMMLYSIYERFVANFYCLHLKDWDVSAQKRLDWHAKNTNEHLPQMVPDLVLQEHTRQGSGRIIILDTKFTAHSLVENQWGKPIYDSSHLYQLYAYLKSQEHLSEAHQRATGILLYPVVHERFAERVELQDHAIRIESVDLAGAWEEIERQLMEVIIPPSSSD